jgi:cell division protease FtsH
MSDEQKKLNTDPGGGFKPKFNFYWVYGFIALAFIAIQFMNTSTVEEITWQRFETELLKERYVDKIVVVNHERAEIFLTEDAKKSGKFKEESSNSMIPTEETPSFFFNIGSVETFEKKLEDAETAVGITKPIEVSYHSRTSVVSELLNWGFPIIMIVVLWVILFRRMNGGGGPGGANIFSIGKSKAKVFDKEENNININFDDVAGLEEAKVEIQEIVDFLKKPEKYTLLGGKIPKGALLVGPPGTGKTLLAKAVAGEAHVPFFSMSGSDFVEMFVGVGASRVRDLFGQAKAKAPCIIFIDEIDAIGRARGRNANFGANDERENTLNQLLTEMDGFDTNTGVIILAATNRADILDKALLRAGRFDRQIHVELPDVTERKQIFDVHTKPLKIGEGIDREFLAKQTPGFSGADIANVCNEAALIAARKNHSEVGRQDFLDAIDRIIGGLEKKNKIITLEEKRTIAFHEAGHATVSWLSKYASPLVKVTIIPRGQALGAAWYLPEERKITTTEQITDELAATLGGRAAEELMFGKISTGALNDLERVTKQAYAMVSYYGMSEAVGNLSFFDSSGQNEYGFSKPYSERTAELIDKEARRIIDEAYKKAIDLLKTHKEGLVKLGDLLLEREVIFTEDVERIFGPRVGTSSTVWEPIKAKTEELTTTDLHAPEDPTTLIPENNKPEELA